jgi:hypothetical protein
MNPTNFLFPRTLRTRSCLLALLLGLIGLLAGFSSNSTFTEAQVKSLFLLNFTKYVDWPATAFAGPDAPLVIGIYGQNNFGEDLEKTVADKSANGHRLVIRQLRASDDLTQCHILFLSGLEPKKLVEILAKVKAAPVLTVGETEPFLELGGMINFMKKDGKIRLEINPATAQEAQLQISSKLLSVADTVKGRTK